MKFPLLVDLAPINKTKNDLIDMNTQIKIVKKQVC